MYDYLQTVVLWATAILSHTQYNVLVAEALKQLYT